MTPNIMIKRPASQAIFLTTQTITIFCAAFKHCRGMLDIFSLELTLASHILSSQPNQYSVLVFGVYGKTLQHCVHFNSDTLGTLLIILQPLSQSSFDWFLPKSNHSNCTDQLT